ncbi:MAG: trypsin-like peptidase domain-containing protein [Planctomycetes bacterium]|nr:trypsin-like peptidase domain-containing protein [Planctomycetota bacterium]
MTRHLVVLALLVLPFADFRATAEDPPAQEARPRAIAEFEDAVAALAEKARPSLVRIAGHYQFGDEDQKKDPDFYVSNEFSGVIYSAEGHVITVASAVRGAKRIEVILGGDLQFEAETVGIDDLTNLAVVKFDPGAAKLAPVKFGDSDAVKPGHFVLAVGNPYGLSGSLSHGMVSGIRRSVGGGVSTLVGLMQITAPINPGDAGGLAVNSRGELIGILSSTFQRASAFDDWDQLFEEFKEGFDWDRFRKELKKNEGSANLPKDLQELVERLMEDRKKALAKRRSAGMRFPGEQLGAEGINFVTPSNTVKKVADALIRSGKVERGFLGIRVAPVEPALRKHLEIPPGRGVLVVIVTRGSPAAEAGLEMWDVVLSVDGQDIADIETLAELVMSKTGGETVTIKLLREKKELELKATIGKSK